MNPFVRLLRTLLSIWRSLYDVVSREETAWRRLPHNDVTALLVDLKPSTRKTYLALLREFEVFAQVRHLALNSREDVDHAAYVFIGCHTRSKGENLLAALRRCYPPLRPYPGSRLV